MITDESFGIIPLRREVEAILVLLIQHVDAHGGHWSFPKGHKNGYESDHEAALRELTEETGITAVTLVPNQTFVETYDFTWNGHQVAKKVHYFVGWVDDPTVHIQDTEIQNYAWLAFDEAREQLTFARAMTLLAEVEAWLKENAPI